MSKTVNLVMRETTRVALRAIDGLTGVTNGMKMDETVRKLVTTQIVIATDALVVIGKTFVDAEE